MAILWLSSSHQAQLLWSQNTITSRQSKSQLVEHCGAQNNANMACCVLEGVTTQLVGLWPWLTYRTGHHGHWILSCPDKTPCNTKPCSNDRWVKGLIKFSTDIFTALAAISSYPALAFFRVMHGICGPHRGWGNGDIGFMQAESPQKSLILRQNWCPIPSSFPSTK